MTGGGSGGIAVGILVPELGFDAHGALLLGVVREHQVVVPIMVKISEVAHHLLGHGDPLLVVEVDHVGSDWLAPVIVAMVGRSTGWSDHGLAGLRLQDLPSATLLLFGRSVHV